MIEEMADFFKVLSEPLRLALLMELRGSEKSVSELAAFAGTSLANVSKHLMIMRRAGIVERRKDGNQVRYRLSSETILEICDFICKDIRSRLDHRMSAIEVRDDGGAPGTPR
jgi:DNA-binding transcriptional ArsR family regulator